MDELATLMKLGIAVLSAFLLLFRAGPGSGIHLHDMRWTETDEPVRRESALSCLEDRPDCLLRCRTLPAAC